MSGECSAAEPLGATYARSSVKSAVWRGHSKLLLGHGAVGERGTSGNAPKAHAQVEGAAEPMKVEELAPVE